MTQTKSVGDRYRALPTAGRASVVTFALVVTAGAALIACTVGHVTVVRVAATASTPPAGVPAPVIAGSALQPGARQVPASPPTTDSLPPPPPTTAAPTTTTTTAGPAVQLTPVAVGPGTPTASTALPAGYKACAASVTLPSPPPGSYETVKVSGAPPATAGTVLVHYRTQTNPYPITTGPDGTASYVFSIGTARPGYTVEVDVTVGSRSVCSTSFTPQ